MYRMEVKHAFQMNEIKQNFTDAVSEPVKGYYDLLLETDIEEKAKKHNIAETEEVPGNFGFQVRIVQTEKVVELHAFAKHQWEEPSVNDLGYAKDPDGHSEFLCSNSRKILGKKDRILFKHLWPTEKAINRPI